MPDDDFIDVGLSTRIRAAFPDTPPTMSDDGYPGVFQDQRTMLAGGLDCETGDDVFWKCWVPHLERHQGIAPRMDEHARELVPYLNAGRWIADCPACGSGIALWDRNPYGCCLGFECGRIYNVRWQTPMLRSEVMRLLAGWPEGNRNWNAHEGETVDELKMQGVLMLGVPAVERNALLVAENVHVPDDFTDVNEYLDSLRRARRER